MSFCPCKGDLLKYSNVKQGLGSRIQEGNNTGKKEKTKNKKKEKERGAEDTLA